MKPVESVSLVIPVFNEKDNLGPLFREIQQVLSKLTIASEVIFVDDGSTDGSWQEMCRVESEEKSKISTVLLRLTRNSGQTAAMLAGFDAAKGEIVIPLDADMQNDPADIPTLIRLINDGFDVVSGWRKDRKDKSLTRKLPSWVANRLLGFTTGVHLHDYGCTLKAYRRSFLSELRLYGDMHRFIPVYLAQFGARITEVVVNHRPRAAGDSKYGPRRVISVAIDLVLLRFMSKYYLKPIQFFGHWALGFLSAAAASFIMMVALKFGWLKYLGIDYTASFVQTPLPALTASFIVGMFTSIFFGVIAELLVRIHFESQGRLTYRIAESIAEPRSNN